MERPEIVIGLVYAAGTNMEPVTDALTRALLNLDYTEKPIRLSKLLEVIPLPPEKALQESPYEAYLTSRMNAGTYWRETMGRGDAMALLGISKIRDERREYHSAEAEGEVMPIHNAAFVLRSLKHPKEVETLREVYGPTFFLISIYEAKHQRIDHLARKIASSHYTSQFERSLGRAIDLIDTDDAEDGKALGQQVRKTFWQGDAFIRLGDTGGLEKQLQRILEIWFGHPFHTPTRDEYAMFSAQAAAYRSASMGRQVGAVITTPDGSIVATGANEVPKAGGGPYWSEDPSDGRDHILGQDSSDFNRHDLLGDIVKRMHESGWLAKNKTDSFSNGAGSIDVGAIVEKMLRDREAPPIMDGAMFTNLTEFQRPVHAEMTALTDAARRGVPVEGCTMYTSTFPCHGCARHIVASGIERLVYIEPYVKSLAQNLHEDSIYVDDTGNAENRVRFEPFVGVAPRRYMELFPMTNRKEKNGEAVKWSPHTAAPRLNGWVHNLSILNEHRLVFQTSKAVQQAEPDDTPSEQNEGEE